jgi:BirA family biotin operon repressor/biotin-[acetyl-CoA-carboxylase] ligase
MNEEAVQAALREIPLGGLRVFERLGSTNDEARAWASGGALDLSLVLADEQTQGRGRSDRRWYTPAGTALAFSLILRPSATEAAFPMRLSGVASLAVADALARVGLHPGIKWPNDVLVGGRKLAGILVESVWNDNALDACILGIGINVLAGSAPSAEDVSFPATTVEDELKRLPDRLALLRDVLAALLEWRGKLASKEFIAAWENRLVFRGENVTLSTEGRDEVEGTLVGLDTDGSLLLLSGRDRVRMQIGELRLRQTSDRIA